MKNILPWSHELETGIELIDSQHKEFLKNANKFIIKLRAEKEVDAAMEEIGFLQNYLLYHFQAEETFQFESGFDNYLKHQAEHKQLTFQVKEMSTKLKVNNFSSQSIDDFCAFINKWVMGHILNSDLEFARYYNSKK